jgi:hypothetical protein
MLGPGAADDAAPAVETAVAGPTGREIVAPFRDIDITTVERQLQVLGDIAGAIDKVLAKKDAAIESATGAMRIADAERKKAEQLAAERLQGLLAAAEFSTILAKQLRLEQS